MHYECVLVLSRSGSGQWTHWRVGRRRLAWMPGSRILRETLAAGEASFIIAVPLIAWWLVQWACVLLATLAAWPWRMASGRWPVVAYPLNVPDHHGTLICWVAR
ncbi:hypothetical protein GCM10010201_35000 [Pilimelia columellifera subsp. columellifera]|uniref:Uncharacterized protein n=1 Tax=Pilimelia columellifera subsp. columellifera TaxID=706583 RepID=A0ABP6B1S6_9ACTN